MKKTTFRDYIDSYVSGMKDFFEDLFPSMTDDPTSNIMCKTVSWLGTAALTISAVSAFTTGAILPGLLFAAGTATLATDVIVNMKQNKPSLITRCLMTAITAIGAPLAVTLIYPFICAGTSISEAIAERREARKSASTRDYTDGYDKTASSKAVAESTESTSQFRKGPDFSYDMPDDPIFDTQKGEYIEELEDPDFDPKTSGDDPMDPID